MATNVNLTKFDQITGQIIAVYSVWDEDVDHYLNGEPDLYVGAASLTTDYFVNGAPVPRPQFGIALSASSVQANGTDVLTIRGVPNGTKVLIEGPNEFFMTTTADGTALTPSFAFAGLYVFSFELFPYMPLKLNVNAT